MSFVTGDVALCDRMVDEVRALIPGSAPLRRHARKLAATSSRIARVSKSASRRSCSHAKRTPLRRATYLLRSAQRSWSLTQRVSSAMLRAADLASDFFSGVAYRLIGFTCAPGGGRFRESANYRLFPPVFASWKAARALRGGVADAVLSPGNPYPLAHGGAVRIYHLLRKLERASGMSSFFAFTDGQAIEAAPVLGFCARVVPSQSLCRYREPRWSTLLPPEVHEFRSPAMRRALGEEKLTFGYNTPYRWNILN